MTDYKDTVYQPKTDFSMRAGLPTKEPQILKVWEDIGLYKKLGYSICEKFGAYKDDPLSTFMEKKLDENYNV